MVPTCLYSAQGKTTHRQRRWPRFCGGEPCASARAARLRTVTVEGRDSEDGGVHHRREIERAVSALGPGGLRGMGRAAHAHIRDFGLDPVRQKPHDLLYAAIGQTLEGRRSWRKGVDFERHLREVMRSIAFNWRRSAARAEAAGRREVRFSELWPPDEYVDPMDLPISLQASLASPLPDPEARLITKEKLVAVLRHCADDEPASLLIACWFEGLNGREMRRRLEIKARQLKTMKERIRRKARRMEAGDVE